MLICDKQTSFKGCHIWFFSPSPRTILLCRWKQQRLTIVCWHILKSVQTKAQVDTYSFSKQRDLVLELLTKIYSRVGRLRGYKNTPLEAVQTALTTFVSAEYFCLRLKLSVIYSFLSKYVTFFETHWHEGPLKWSFLVRSFVNGVK